MAQFFSDPTNIPQELKSETLESLISIGAVQLALVPDVTGDHLSELLAILARFIVEEESEDGDTNDRRELVQEHSLRQPRGENPSFPHLNSVEAEKKISAAFQQLRESDAFAALQLRKVGEFWTGEFVRAPFIEELTFKELVAIPVDFLLKKRTFGNSKIHGLVHAINLALQSATPAVGRTTVGNSAVPDSQSIRYVSPPLWEALSPHCAGSLHLLIQAIEEERMRLAQSNSFLARLLEEIPLCLSQVEFLALWFSGEGGSSVFAELARETPHCIEGYIQSGKEKLLSQLQQNFLAETEAFKEILGGAGVSEKSLHRLFFGLSAPHFTSLGILRVLCVTLGAVPPAVNETEIHGYWSLQSKGLESIVLASSRQFSNYQEQLDFLVLSAHFFEREILENLLKNLPESTTFTS
ncbi:MAG: hypothetical protein KDD60_03420 [Bdellovibrionales bacterium]|nr:hypothetical protein [Bdellovibrionales bacterium]